MPNPDHTPATAASQTESAAPRRLRSEGRRRLLINGGAAVGPVVLTLASKSVLATNGGGCLSPSATLSGNLSHVSAQTGTCTGQGGGSWCNQTNWPISKDTPFHSIFAVGNRTGTRYFKTDQTTSLTLKEVLNPSATGDAKIAYLFVTAYLNIKAGSVPTKVLKAEGLQAMWREWAVAGQYTPFAGANPTWKAAEITNYLTTSKIAPS